MVKILRLRLEVQEECSTAVQAARQDSHLGSVSRRLSGFQSGSDSSTYHQETDPEMFCYVPIKLTKVTVGNGVGEKRI